MRIPLDSIEGIDHQLGFWVRQLRKPQASLDRLMLAWRAVDGLLDRRLLYMEMERELP